MADLETTDKTPAPWGDDFDAERAWKLVQNLRAENADLKGKADSLKAENDTLKANTGSESEKIAAAEKRAVAAEKALYVERAVRKHPELEDFADLLSGDSEEEVLKKAERLAAIGKKPEEKPADGGAPAEQKPDEKPGESKDGDDDENAGLPGKPTPDLIPGHGGQEATPFDPVAIAKAARR